MSFKSVEKTAENQVSVEMTIDAETFKKAVDDEIRKEGKRITVPGFRKGKAPKAIIEKEYGRKAFYESALDSVFPDVYEKDIKDNNVEAVDNPVEFKINTIDETGVELSFKVDVKPEVKIDDYKGIEAEKAEVVVTDEDVENELKKQQEDNARFTEVERPVESGDIATIDYKGRIDGKEFAGGSAEDYDLTIGSGSFIPGFEDQLIGHKTGEEFDITVKFPSDYGAEDLAGKEAVFSIKIKEVKIKELPALDDDFAKDVSEFDTIDELRADTKKNITEARENQAETDFRNNVLDKLSEKVTNTIPNGMTQRAVQDMMNEFDYNLRMSQGVSLEQYMKYTGMTEQYFAQLYHDRAEKNVKVDLALEYISKAENIEASDEEYEEEVNTLAKNYNMEPDKFKEAVSKETILDNIIRRKTIDLVVKAAVATAPKPDEKKDDESEKADSSDDKKEDSSEEKTEE